MHLLEQLKIITESIHKQKPLILNLTNYVTQDFIANSLLAIGAAPIMSESIDELPELTKIANSININIGTLNQDFINKIDCVMNYLAT
jgi:hydroxyethylthiazole kinase